MSNGINVNPLNDITKVYLDQIANAKAKETQKDIERWTQKEEVVKEGKKKKRWQDDDGDGKWYEKSDVDGKISKREKEEKKKNQKEEVEIVNEISPDLALKASKEADKKRGKLAAAGDKEGAAKKSAQASRLYKAQANKRLNREETEIIDDLVESGLFSDEEIKAILDLEEE